MNDYSSTSPQIVIEEASRAYSDDSIIEEQEELEFI